MRKKSYLVILLIISLFVAVGGTLAEAQGDRQHFLWEVSAPPAKVYILGSLHFFPEQMYPLDSVIEAAYQGSTELAVEVDLSKTDQAKIQQFIMEKATYPSNDHLKNHLSTSTYNAVQKHLNANGMDIADFSRLRPWFLATFLTTMELQKAGFNPSYGIDRYFIEKAVQDRKPIVELETWDFQLNLLNSLDDELQEAYLQYSIEDLDNTSTILRQLESSWRTGDTAAMEKLVFSDPDPRLQPIYEKMFYRRNQDMATKIEGYIKSGKTIFIVVGSGHLVGRKGIVSLLRQRGYTTRQL